MEYKDYYQILGVDKKANDQEIKSAYRKLALKYHPDRNPNDKKAEETFKEINEAYQVLSDPEKRRRYEQLGDSYGRYTQRGGAPGSFNWDDWYSSSPVGGTGNVRMEVGDMEDLLRGVGGFSEFFSRIFGGMPGRTSDGFSTQSSRGRQKQPGKPSYEQAVEISLIEAFQGTSRRVELEGRRLDVKIPPGAKTGTKVRVQDAFSTADGQKGDLILVIRVLPDERYEQKGSDLYIDLPIDVFTAVLGGELPVPTLSGNVVLTIPAGTQPGQTFRLSGRGMPGLKNPESHGDLFVRARITIPRKLTPPQRDLFQQLAKLK